MLVQSSVHFFQLFWNKSLVKKKSGPAQFGVVGGLGQAFTFLDFEVPSSVHFFRFWNSVIEKQKSRLKKLDPKKAVFRAGKRKNAKKRTRHFRPSKCACAQ